VREVRPKFGRWSRSIALSGVSPSINFSRTKQLRVRTEIGSEWRMERSNPSGHTRAVEGTFVPSRAAHKARLIWAR